MTVPNAKLEVDSNDAFRTVQLTGVSPAIYFNEDDSASTDNWHLGVNGGALYFLRDTDKNGAYNNIAAFFSGNNLISEGNFYAKGNTFSFGASTSEGEYISRSGNDIRFIDGGNTVMTVDGDSSNVGIGTTSPGAELEVGGAGAVLRVGPRYTSGGDRDFIDLISHGTDSKLLSNNERFSIENNAGHIIINPSGNLGIETTDPLAKFHVQKANSGRTWTVHGNTVACLLYTSPSPRDGLLSRMPSSA